MMTDDEIKAAILNYFGNKLNNLRGDHLLEGPCNGDEKAYWRAGKLLDGAELRITWADAVPDPRLGCHCLEFAEREYGPDDEPPY